MSWHTRCFGGTTVSGFQHHGEGPTTTDSVFILGYAIHIGPSSTIDLMFPQHCKGCGNRSDGGGTFVLTVFENPLRLHPFTTTNWVRAAWALGVYEGVLESMICRGKYGKDGQAIALLGDSPDERLIASCLSMMFMSWIGRWRRVSIRRSSWPSL